MKFEKFCDYFLSCQGLFNFTQALKIQIKLLDFLSRVSRHVL